MAPPPIPAPRPTVVDDCEHGSMPQSCPVCLGPRRPAVDAPSSSETDR